MRDISWLAEWLIASEQGLCSIELFRYFLASGWSGARDPARDGHFSLQHRVQTDSGAHPASYPMGNTGAFPGGKAAVVLSWQLTFIKCQGQRMCGDIPPHPNTPSWRGAQFKQTLPFTTNNTNMTAAWIWCYSDTIVTTSAGSYSFCGTRPSKIRNFCHIISFVGCKTTWRLSKIYISLSAWRPKTNGILKPEIWEFVWASVITVGHLQTMYWSA